MEFCNICNNKLYLNEDNNKLYLICRKCGFKKKNKKNVIITKTYDMNEIKINTINNKYIIYDSTIPRTIIKDCPNDKCISQTDKTKRKAVFYPDKKTRELNYVCCNCFCNWKLS